MGDFDACRFDFRFDAKNGLMPSKRKRIERCSQINYGTLFKCKLCSSLFPSRAQLLEHKLFHSSDYNCAICGRMFAKRARLRDHVNNDHHLNEETKQEHAYTTLDGCEITGLAPELIESGTTTATLSPDTMRMNDEQLFQYITDKNNVIYNKKRRNNFSNVSPFSFATSNDTDSVNTLVYDTAQPPDYFSVNLAQFFPSSSLSDSTNAQPPRLDARPSQSFALQPPTFKRDTDQTSDEVSEESTNRTGNPSAAAGYLARIQAMKNHLATNQASYLKENSFVIQETGDSKIVVKQEPMDIETANDGESYSSVVEKFPLKSNGGDEIWDYSLKSNLATGDHAVCQTAVDLSLKTVVFNNEITSTGELASPSGEIHCNSSNLLKLESDISLGENEVAGTIIDVSNQADDCYGSKLFKIGELNSNCVSNKHACGFRSTATRKAKAGLSNMVEKLWKSKLIDSINRKTSEINNETTTTTPALITQEVHSEHSDSAPLKSAHATSGEYCQMQFRACLVCQQLFENSKVMWDHALTHPEYKKRHGAKRKSTLLSSSSSSSSSIEDKQIEHYSLPQDSMTSCMKLDMTNIVPTENGSFSPTIKCASFSSNFSACDGLFGKDSSLNQYHADHADMKSLNCPLCSYSCHHVILLEQHLLDKHKQEDSAVNNKQSHPVGLEDADMFRLNEFVENLVSNPEILKAAGGKIVFPTEETATNEFLRREWTNRDFADKIAEASPLLINDVCFPASNDIDTKSDVKLDHLIADDMPVYNVQAISVKTEPIFDDRIVPRQTCNAVGKLPAKLLLRRVKPAPVNDPPFYTSVMKLSYGSSSAQQQSITDDLNETVQSSSPLERSQDDSADGDQSKDIYSNVALTDGTKLYCDASELVSDTAGDLLSHLRSSHGTEMGEINDSNLTFECHMGYSTFAGFKPPFQRCQGEMDASLAFVCPWDACAAKHHTKTTLKNHVRLHLAGKSTQRCLQDGCVKKFESESELLNHVAAHSRTERPLVCGYNGCDKAFRELKHLKVHQMQHTDLKPLRCELCEYSCRQRNSMNWHMKSQHGLEKHVTADGRTIYS